MLNWIDFLWPLIHTDTSLTFSCSFIVHLSASTSYLAALARGADLSLSSIQHIAVSTLPPTSLNVSIARSQIDPSILLTIMYSYRLSSSSMAADTMRKSSHQFPSAGTCSTVRWELRTLCKSRSYARGHVRARRLCPCARSFIIGYQYYCIFVILIAKFLFDNLRELYDLWR